MELNQDSLKFIFGLKMSNLRKDRCLSLKELAESSGLSASYLNEIENGKKYPKPEKIVAIAKALNVPYEELIADSLSNELSRLSSLLKNSPLSGLPLDLFGISSQTLFQFIAKDPKAFTALTGTFVELARIFNIQVEDVYLAVLRSYLHLNRNYFPEIEEQVEHFRRKYQIPHLDPAKHKEDLKSILLSAFHMEVLEADFNNFPKPVRGLYFFVQQSPYCRIYINKHIGSRQKIFVLAREIGYQFLGLKTRFMTSVTDHPENYSQLYNLFAASYFASALIIPKQKLVEETSDFFKRKVWDNTQFSDWVHSYAGTRRSFFHRLSQLLPEFFNLENIFYFRFNYQPGSDNFRVVKELHLSELQVPHRLKGIEHYCRRWIATSLLQELSTSGESFRAGIQRAQFMGTEREYLCISMAYPLNLDPKSKEGITLGILIDEKVKDLVGFLDDENIPKTVVSRFCEWCDISNCKERVAPFSVHESQGDNEFLKEWIQKPR
jgi:transcriptional regulator with XRE-family HTH domain